MKGIKPLPSKTWAIQNMHPPKIPKQVYAFLGLVGYYRKFIKNFAKIAEPLTLLTHQQATFEWTPTHHNAFLMLKELVLSKSEETLHSLHICIWWCLWSTTFPGTQQNRIPYCFPFPHIHGYSTEIEHHRTRSLWCILCSHKVKLLPSRSWNNSKKWPQATGKISEQENANNKVNRWGLELATYNTTFQWISGAGNKAADCLTHLVELFWGEPTTINMFSATHSDGPAFNTRGRTAQQSSPEDSIPQTDTIWPDVTDTQSSIPKSMSADRLEALLQMQNMDPYWKCISKQLSNGKAPKHEADLFIHVKGLLYKHITDSHQKVLALMIP